jgi:hypothetical protein
MCVFAKGFFSTDCEHSFAAFGVNTACVPIVEQTLSSSTYGACTLLGQTTSTVYIHIYIYNIVLIVLFLYVYMFLILIIKHWFYVLFICTFLIQGIYIYIYISGFHSIFGARE